MNDREAKFILGAYRPGGRDAGDALFHEALEQAQDDPALGAWFARAQAHDAAVAAKLAEIAPPPGLREAILAGARASRSRRPLWRRAVWLTLATAAAIAVIGSLALPALRARAGERRFADFVLADVADTRDHHNDGDPARVLQAWLSRPTTRLPQDLTIDFAALRASGCRTLNFGGKPVIEVCFQRDGHWFHLYAIRVSDLPEGRDDPAPAMLARDRYACASWPNAANGMRFIVATAGDEAELARLL